MERLFGLVKYTDLDRNTQSTLQKLVWVLLEETHLRYVTNRGLMLAGRTTSEQQRSAAEEEAEVEALVASGKVRPAVVGIPDLTYNVGSNTVCVGDLSCTCPTAVRGGQEGGQGTPDEGQWWSETSGHSTAVYGTHVLAPTLPVCACPASIVLLLRSAAERVCKHVRAATRVYPITLNRRSAAAARLLSLGTIVVGEEQEERRGSETVGRRLCHCPTFTHGQKNVFFRPRDGFCSCHDQMLHGTCCHLLAAAQLPEFAGLYLPATACQEAENKDEVSGSKRQARLVGGGGREEQVEMQGDRCARGRTLLAAATLKPFSNLHWCSPSPSRPHAPSSSPSLSRWGLTWAARSAPPSSQHARPPLQPSSGCKAMLSLLWQSCAKT